MTEETTKTNAKMNGVGAHLAHIRLTDKNPNDNGLGSSSSQQTMKGQTVSSSSQKKTFKSVVQRHFVRDKLFFLVNELLKSADEERRAQEDLIASFKTAREVTGPIRRQTLSAPSHRTKRRRKRADTPLLDRIEQSRKDSREPLENIEFYKKDVAAVGEMKITANEKDDTESEYEGKAVNKGKETSLKTVMEPEASTETVQINSDMDIDTMKYKHNVKIVENDLQKSRQRSKSLPAGETEKFSAIYKLNRDENTSDIDKLVLDSVLHDNDTVDVEHPQKEAAKTENGNGNTSENDEKSSSELTVAVESSSESDEDETNIKVIGSNDEVEEDDVDEDIEDIDNEYELQKVKHSNLYLSTAEHNRMSTSLHPTLDPIAEASSESFQSAPLSSRDSSSIIEIESKTGAFSWQVDGNVNVQNGTVKTNPQENLYNVQISEKGYKCNSDQPNTTDIRKNIWVVDCKDKKVGKVHTKTKKETREADETKMKRSQYRNTGKVNDSELDYNKNEKLDTQQKPDRTSQQTLKSSARKKREQGKELLYSSTDGRTNFRSEPTQKNKSKSNRRISIDLLGVYEENTDLQRVSRSEIDTSKQNAGKGKSTPSPKRSRSKSPTKKRSRENKKCDMRPLPPRVISSSTSRSRNNPSLTLYRSKTELSSHSNSNSSFEDMKELHKNLQCLKHDRRYERPDFVLWERLDISEGSAKDRKEGVKWSDDFSHEVKHRYSGLTENSARNDTCADGRKVTWNVPINEAIKSITSSKNVPDISKISHTVPREERVGRLYIDLKQERRSSGLLEYRQFNTSDRKEDLDEFTHL